MLKKAAIKVFGTKHDRDMKKIQPLVSHINSLEKPISALSDERLKNKTNEFLEALEKGKTLDDILPETFAVVRESAKRTVSMRHYDVQLIGGYFLHTGQITEMKTGEGKTLVATLAIYLNALTKKGCHLVTVNDYLASRDAEWMGKLYNFLNLSVGVVTQNKSDKERKEAYNQDITYATNNQLGFDYLRDNMKYSLDDYVQRKHNFAIVDECDSILIDEARTPLIISGPSEQSTDKYLGINKIIPNLKMEEHFTIEEKSKSAMLTDAGNSRVEELLKIDNLYEPQNIDLLHHIYQALKAHHLFNRDTDYMVKDNEVVIVDEFTGRLQVGRRWSDGLHQAIEAKEGVKVKNESQTLASITYQNYFRIYNKLSGMTGTADTEAVEFKKIYNLDVTVIPTNKPIARDDIDDVIYKTEDAKYKAIASDIKDKNNKGQPVLVGTVSIEKSEKLSNFLNKLNVKHSILNAKFHEREAEIVAQAGRKGSVTIATNMAGRGTDIVLGGNPEALAKHSSKDQESDTFKVSLDKFTSICEPEKQEVIKAGGLHIIGTERHESRRIDNQLRGRSGRQGDPGSSLFYLSMEDSLMRIFGGEKIKNIMHRLNVPDDDPITAPMVSRAIEGAQRKVEGHNFEIRKNLIDYDDVMNQQRNTIYSLRKQVLDGDNTEEIIKEYLGELTSEILDRYAPLEVQPDRWDKTGFSNVVNKLFGFEIDITNINNPKELTEFTRDKIRQAFEAQKESLGENYENIKKIILLQTIDHKWKDHLQIVDHIRESVSLRSFAQKDPLIEYKKEAFSAFESMDYAIKKEVIEKVFKIQIVASDGIAPLDKREVPKNIKMSSPEAESAFRKGLPFKNVNNRQPMKSKEPIVREGAKVGRNDPCHCGSGKKYKKCCGA